MDFARPSALLLLLLIPFVLLMAKRDRSRRAKAWLELGQSGKPSPGRWRTWSWAGVALIIGLAGPRIGLAPGSERPPGHDVVIVIDDSRSMAAEDAVPNRLEAAKLAASQLIRAVSREAGSRIAIIAFAGGLEPLCPLTDRYEAALDSLQLLKAGDVRPGGTSLSMALAGGLEVFDDLETSQGRSIVIFSDGDDLEDFDKSLINRLRSTGIVFHSVTFGDSETGHTIPVGQAHTPLIYQGEVVTTRRHDQVLSKVSQSTGGLLIPAGRTRPDMDALYRERIAPSETARRESNQVPERVDRAPWFLAAALGFLGTFSWPRPRKLVLLASFLCLMIGAGAPVESPRELTARGLAAYRQGRFEDARKDFEIALKCEPNSSLAAYNLASVLYQLGHFDDAARFYEQAREKADPTLSSKIDFALGNVAVASGRYQEAIESYDRCLNSTAVGPSVSAVKGDAVANRAFAQKRLPPPVSPDPEGDRNTPKRPNDADSEPPKRDPPPENGSDPDSQPPPPPKGSSPPSDSGSNPSPRSGNPPTDSPQSRLDEMLREVRKAQSASREGDSRPDSAPSTNRKDW